MICRRLYLGYNSAQEIVTRAQEHIEDNECCTLTDTREKTAVTCYSLLLCDARLACVDNKPCSQFSVFNGICHILILEHPLSFVTSVFCHVLKDLKTSSHCNHNQLSFSWLN